MRLAGLCILIVDDDPNSLDMASQVLEFHGAEVLTASDGRAMLALVAVRLPDLILLDLSMPLMDGWEALRTLKELPTLSGTPVIALTAHAMRRDEAAAIEAGFDGYLSKPVKIREMVEQVAGWLGR